MGGDVACLKSKLEQRRVGLVKSQRAPRNRCLAVCSVEKSRPRSSHWREERGRERLLTPLEPTLNLLKPLKKKKKEHTLGR